MSIDLNQTLIIPGQHIYTYKEVMDSLGDQVMSRFLYIGLIIIICALWSFFGGGRRTDKFSIFFDGVINILAIVAGLVSIGFYVIYKYGGL